MSVGLLCGSVSGYLNLSLRVVQLYDPVQDWDQDMQKTIRCHIFAIGRIKDYKFVENNLN